VRRVSIRILGAACLLGAPVWLAHDGGIGQQGAPSKVAKGGFVPPPLVDWGATLREWNLNHHPDPLAVSHDGYWPRLANGEDTYSDVRVVRGHVLYYTLELYPAETLGVAVKRMLDELPPDTEVAGIRLLPRLHPNCAVILARSSLLRARLGLEVLGVARSPTADFSGGQVSEVALSPLRAGEGLPKRC